MALSQSLHACFQSNVEGKARLCHVGLHGGLFVTVHLGTDKNPPLVADLIPVTEQLEDFNKKTRSANIEPVKDIAKLIYSHDIKNCCGIFIKWEAGMGALISVCNEGRSVKTLTVSGLEMMVYE